jgi:organic radical activating enzyme
MSIDTNSVLNWIVFTGGGAIIIFTLKFVFRSEVNGFKKSIEKEKEIEDKANTERSDLIKKLLEKISVGMDSLKDLIHDLESEVKENYLKTSRFENHETKNDESFRRVHERIDELNAKLSVVKKQEKP